MHGFEETCVQQQRSAQTVHSWEHQLHAMQPVHKINHAAWTRPGNTLPASHKCNSEALVVQGSIEVPGGGQGWGGACRLPDPAHTIFQILCDHVRHSVHRMTTAMLRTAGRPTTV